MDEPCSDGEQMPHEPWATLVESELRLAQQLQQLRTAAWLLGREANDLVDQPVEISTAGMLGELLLEGGDPPPEELASIREIVACGDVVQRRAHERRLDDMSPLDCAQQLLRAESLEARPESDVWRRRPLRLERTDALHGLRHAEPRPPQEELARQERAVQLANGQDALAKH